MTTQAAPQGESLATMQSKSETVPYYAPRIAAAVSVVGLGLLLGTGWYWLAALLAVDFLLRAINRPEWSFSGLLYQRLVARFLGQTAKASRTAWPPKRFAARVGLAFLIAIAAIGLLAPESGVAPVLTLLMLPLAALEATAGFCVACRFYSLLGRFHLVAACPEGRCDLPPAEKAEKPV